MFGGSTALLSVPPPPANDSDSCQPRIRDARLDPAGPTHELYRFRLFVREAGPSKEWIVSTLWRGRKAAHCDTQGKC